MPTQETTIKRTRGPELVFRGELVAKAAATTRDPLAHGRWHEISIYRRSDNMWVVSIEFHTLSLHESPYVEVEVVDDACDIETVMMFYEPTEHLNRRMIEPRRDGERLTLLHTIRTDFDRLVGSIRDQVKPVVEQRQAERRAYESRIQPGGPWHHLLCLLGIR